MIKQNVYYFIDSYAGFTVINKLLQEGYEPLYDSVEEMKKLILHSHSGTKGIAALDNNNKRYCLKTKKCNIIRKYFYFFNEND